VQVVESRAVYDVPSETVVLEDFEGASIDEFQTQAVQGNPSFSIAERDGSDVAKIDCDSGDFGLIGLGLPSLTDVDVFQASGEVELGRDNTQAQFYTHDAPSSSAGIAIDSKNGLVFIALQGIPYDQRDVSANEIVNSKLEFSLTVDKTTGEITAKVVTPKNEYNLSHTFDTSTDIDTSGGWFVTGGVQGLGVSYWDNIKQQGQDEGQLSSAIAHSDLADAPASAHHVRPTAGAGIQDNNDTFRTQYPPEDLSQRTGDYDGEVAADDGTNTPVRGTLCVWDANNTVWRPQNDPDTGSF